MTSRVRSTQNLCVVLMERGWNVTYQHTGGGIFCGRLLLREEQGVLSFTDDGTSDDGWEVASPDGSYTQGRVDGYGTRDSAESMAEAYEVLFRLFGVKNANDATPNVEWARAFASGESSTTADWVLALEDILPGHVDPAAPSQVAAYIKTLRGMAPDA